MRKPNHRSRRQRGQSLVEFALALPIFCLLVLAIVDFGLGLKAWITVTNAAREGARYAAVTCATPDADESAVQLRAVDAAAGLDITSSNVDVDNCPGNSTSSVEVTVSYDYQLVTPLGGIMRFFGGDTASSLELSSRADMRIE